MSQVATTSAGTIAEPSKAQTVKASKGKGKPSKTTIDAGGGIMVDVVDKGSKGEPSKGKPQTASKSTGTNDKASSKAIANKGKPQTVKASKAIVPDKSKSKGKPQTASKRKSKGKTAEPQTYADVRKETDKPLAERKEMSIGRAGASIMPRRFHLTSDRVETLKAEWKDTKRFPNPQNHGGAYHFFLAALINKGTNKPHPFSAVKAEMRSLMSAKDTKDENDTTAWQRFINKEGKGEKEENCLDVDGRLRQNAEVLQRLGGMTPYGLKLLQVGSLVLKTKGAVIDILKGAKDEPQYRLNTNSAEPLNEYRRARK